MFLLGQNNYFKKRARVCRVGSGSLENSNSFSYLMCKDKLLIHRFLNKMVWNDFLPKTFGLNRWAFDVLSETSVIEPTQLINLASLLLLDACSNLPFRWNMRVHGCCLKPEGNLIYFGDSFFNLELHSMEALITPKVACELLYKLRTCTCINKTLFPLWITVLLPLLPQQWILPTPGVKSCTFVVSLTSFFLVP